LRKSWVHGGKRRYRVVRRERRGVRGRGRRERGRRERRG
jgi:hypothetical protein